MSRPVPDPVAKKLVDKDRVEIFGPALTRVDLEVWARIAKREMLVDAISGFLCRCTGMRRGSVEVLGPHGRGRRKGEPSENDMPDTRAKSSYLSRLL